MIVTVDDHSFESDLIHMEYPRILDVGCRNSHCGRWLYNQLRKLACKKSNLIIGIDPDKIEYEGGYYQLALSDFVGLSSLIKTDDPQATRTIRGDQVLTMRLQDFSKMIGVDMWDLIKIDCEGAEREIIMSLSSPPAKQLSIEFHLHTGIYGDKEVKEMEDKLLSLGYFPVKHDKTSEHGAGFNYWDSLWILK